MRDLEKFLKETQTKFLQKKSMKKTPKENPGAIYAAIPGGIPRL